MHIHFADQYRPGHSLVHQLDPRTKAVLAFLFIACASLTPHGAFWAYVALFALVMSAALLSAVGPGYIVKRSFVALPFALAAVTLPFTVEGRPLLQLPHLGGLTISTEGTVRFVSIMIKSWISVQMAILLAAVTPFPDLLWGLQGLRIPKPLVMIVSFLYRYMFVLSDEALRMLRARAARSGRRDGQRAGGRVMWRGKVAGHMVGSLMLRSFERSERIYNAMASRGYQGEIRSIRRRPLQLADYMSLFSFSGCLVLILLAAHVG